jgi:hypothetical protein
MVFSSGNHDSIAVTTITISKKPLQNMQSTIKTEKNIS